MTEPIDPFMALHRPNLPTQPPETFARRLRADLEHARHSPDPTMAPPRRTAMPSTMTTTITPYLCAADADAAIDFYVEAFGATEVMRLVDPKDGRVGHCELSIDGVSIYLASEYPEIGIRNPRSVGADYTTFHLNLRVEDADAWFNRAVAAGASVQRPLADQFYGERSGVIVDPLGYVWTITSTIESVATEEMQRRYDEGAE